jgi:TetR/AcrR family transcriptional regulator, mexJK operon transcriptional repressor
MPATLALQIAKSNETVWFDLTMTAPAGRTARKHAAILAAAREVFLGSGYSGASMDVITQRAGVSKQTVYAHFSTKETLFVEMVRDMTATVSAGVHDVDLPPVTRGRLAGWLEDYAIRQLQAVLTSEVLRLRRLVISEAERFPDLAQAMWDEGPGRAMASLTRQIGDLAAAGLLIAPDPAAAAEQFNWLVMGQPLNQAMLLGQRAVPTTARIRTHARAAVRTFLAAYGPAGEAEA